jgi:hypothetical protein
MVEIIHRMGTYAFYLTTVGFFVFCVLFYILADWRATEMGRHVMTFMTVCAIIMIYSTLNPLIRMPHSVAEVIRFFLLWALAAVVWRHIQLLLKAQRESRLRRDRERKE